MRKYSSTKKLLLFVILFFISNAFTQDAIIEIWNGNTPNLKSGAENIPEVIKDDPTWSTLISKVSKPTIEVYLPAPEIATGTGVVICPGGGYVQLAWDHEGQQVARWFNTIGVAGFILKYRLPDTEIELVPRIAPIQDAHRAIRVVRHHAAEWNLDPDKIGIMGFSAGGHLAGSATVHADSTFAFVDAIDSLSAAPDFLILGYPVVTMGPGTHSGSKSALLGASPDQALVDYFSVEKQVNQNTPPVFIAVANNDGTVPYEPNSLALFNALQNVHVPSELWVYHESLDPNHGFGLGFKSKESIEWPWRLALWMKTNGWSQIVPDKPRYTFLNITGKAMSLRADAAEKMVHIECDTTWSVLQKEADWITVNKQNGDKVDSLWIEISANESSTPRQAKLVIGNSTRVDTVSIIQAAPGRFGLYIAADTDPISSEQEILSTALAAGIVLNPKDDDSIAVTGPESDKVDVILLSDTVNKNKIGDAYRDVLVPVMILETGMFDKMGMTAVRAYGIERSVERLTITNGEHPLSGGLGVGPQTVFSQPASMNWGKPGEQAVKIASIDGDPEKVTIFAYESGSTMMDGFIAPARRMGYFIASSNVPVLTDASRQLLTAALAWLMDKESKVGSNVPVKPPQQFVLQQNYPNPFNPSTNITFSLAHDSHASVVIYNIQGQKITTLLEQRLTLGHHTIQWNGLDITGKRVPSGVYFYKLQTDGSTITRKMVIVQ
jgi:acetyl esterase/lipase